MEEREQWKDVVGYKGLYQVSSEGRVKSLGNGNSTNKNYCKQRILKLRKNKYGYLVVNLNKQGIKRTHTVHQLVANAFIPNPNNYKELNHINEDKADCRACNLEWCSRSYNNSYNSRAKKIGEKLSKPIYGINKINSLIVRFKSAKEAGKALNIASTSITACCKGKKHSAGGYIWHYANQKEGLND